MFKIIVDGEVVEVIVREDEEYSVEQYVVDKFGKDSDVRVEKFLF